LLNTSRFATHLRYGEEVTFTEDEIIGVAG